MDATFPFIFLCLLKAVVVFFLHSFCFTYDAFLERLVILDYLLVLKSEALKSWAWFLGAWEGSIHRITDWAIALGNSNTGVFNLLFLLDLSDTAAKILAPAKRYTSGCHCVGAKTEEKRRESSTRYVNAPLTPLLAHGDPHGEVPSVYSIQRIILLRERVGSFPEWIWNQTAI